MKRTTEITSEVEEIVVLRRSETYTEFCPRCAGLATMASPHAIALLKGLNEREIFRRIEAEEIHFIETHRVFVCLGCIATSKEEIGEVSSLQAKPERTSLQHE